MKTELFQTEQTIELIAAPSHSLPCSGGRPSSGSLARSAEGEKSLQSRAGLVLLRTEDTEQRPLGRVKFMPSSPKTFPIICVAKKDI